MLCVIAAVLVAMFGTGARYLDTFSKSPFLIKLLAAFLIACFFIEFVHQVTIQLDKSFDWKEKPLRRATLQFVLGVILPGVIDLLFLSIYQWYGNIQSVTEEKSSLGSFPIVALPIFLFNIYYLFHYQILRNQEVKQTKKTSNQNLLVQQGTKFIPIPVQDIRYIYHQDRVNYLISKDNARFILNETLEELELKLPSHDFFRINRKMIIHYQSCQHFRSNGHGKLLLNLNPSFEEEVTVSQNRSSQFKEWIKQ